MALALAYAALTLLFAVIGAVFLLTLSAVVTAAFTYEVVRFCMERRRLGV